MYIYEPLEMFKQLFIKYWPYIIASVGVSVFFLIISIFIFILSPKLGFYLKIFTAILILLGTIAVSITIKSLLLLLISLCSLLLYVAYLLSIRNHLDEDIWFMHKFFIKKQINRKIIFLPFLFFGIYILLLSFWTTTLVIIQVRFTIKANKGFDFKL